MRGSLHQNSSLGRVGAKASPNNKDIVISTKDKKFETKKEFAQTGNFHKRGNRFIATTSQERSDTENEINRIDKIPRSAYGGTNVDFNTDKPVKSPAVVSVNDDDDTFHSVTNVGGATSTDEKNGFAAKHRNGSLGGTGFEGEQISEEK